MAKLSRELGAGNLHPRENIFLAGTLAAAGATVEIDSDGASSVGILVTGTYVGTIAVEGTLDGVNYDPIPVKPINAGGIWVLTLASGATGRWQGPCGVFRKTRLRMPAWTSGAASVLIMADNGVSDITVSPKAADGHQTATALVGVAVTLTLPAPAAGLFHIITRLQVQRHASAALTAAATPTLVTTTNLNGRVFSVPVEAAAQGTVYEERLEVGAPLRSQVAGTASTIVAPATTGVIWRLSADYYVAPQ